MKEAPTFVDNANDFVIKVEDEWVAKGIQIADGLKRRAELSNTGIAWNEYHSALNAVEIELFRLMPPEEEEPDE